MKKLAVAMALASTALASPALARDDAWYLSVEGGPMIVEDMNLDIGTINNGVSIDYDTGYDFGGAVGYDFGGFRAEVEVGYREAGADSLIASAARIPSTASAVADFAGTTDVNGSASALSFMLNGMLDFGADDGLQGYVGGGVGVARVDVENVFAAPTWLNDSDTGLAWQGIAGVRAPLSDTVDVGLRYRFFNVDDVNLVDRLGRDVNTRFRSHSLMGTLTFNFGEPAAPPPPPVAQCNSGPYIVFFDWDRDNITADAAATLDNAISAYANCNNTAVMIAGHADRSGSARYNVGLSQRRANNVRAYMAARGIPDGAMTTRAFGEEQNRVPTPDGVRNDQNRRVEINYGPNAGM